MKYYLTFANRLTEKSMKYQTIVLMTPSNITQPFELNEYFYSSHKKRTIF
ncbi:hypothetical protein [Candidatus Enterovibrio altilux]|nr:hypothetical protein [Candidatus Enterovibrio luxaltus]